MRRLQALRLLAGALAVPFAAKPISQALAGQEQAVTAEILAPAAAPVAFANMPDALMPLFQMNFLERTFEQHLETGPLLRLRSGRTIAYTEVRRGLKIH